VGSVFFGSSLFISQRIAEEIGIDFSSDDPVDFDNHHGPNSPRIPTYFGLEHVRMRGSEDMKEVKHFLRNNQPPKFVVLDLTRVTNLDGKSP
jgi:hypothetical protein